MADDPKVKVVNLALGQLGQEPVQDLSDASLEGSTAAVKVLRVLDDARDTILARHGFLCAMQYCTLQPSLLPGTWKFPVVYLLPGDGLAVWEIEGVPLTDFHRPLWAGRWELGTRDTDLGPQVIVRSCNAGGLNVAYTRRCSWGALSTHVRDAIGWEAAYRACYSVTTDTPRTSALKKYAEEKVLLAISRDGTQEDADLPLAPSIPAALRARAR